MAAFPVFGPYRGTATCDDPRKMIAPIGSITRQPNNANTHPERNMRSIRASLRRRGQTQPIIVDRDGMTIVGNGRHEAAELEGWQFIWFVTTHLTGAELLAMGIHDNQSTRTSEWNWELLSTQVRDLKQFDDTDFAFSNDDLAFDDHDLGPILAANWTPEVPRDQDDGNGGTDGSVDPTRTAPGEVHTVSPPPPDAEDRARNDLAITCTPNMRITIDLAIERCRTICADMSISEGRCMELISADYLAKG